MVYSESNEENESDKVIKTVWEITDQEVNYNDKMWLVLKTESLAKTPIYPEESREVREQIGKAKSEAVAKLLLSKIITPQDDTTTTLVYECMMEIAVKKSGVGRRMANNIPDNIVKTEGAIYEVDGAKTRRIAIMKPFGKESKKEILVGAIAVLSIISISTICLKKKNNKNL